MRTARPKHEIAYVRKLVAPLIEQLKKDPKIREAFIEFAKVEANADPLYFAAKVANVMAGKAITEYVLAVMLEFQHKQESAATRRTK